ncbi:MAG: hypothetical protein JWP97_48 [Labilithrix sp.]|nr:hypothetical protein [Labilithrix sp.]
MLAAASGCASGAQLPRDPSEGDLRGADAADAGEAEPTDGETYAIEQREICVGSAVKSAGALAENIYYRAARLGDGRLVVGYYAFFSEERPWGNNWLTWTLLPAIAVDMVYSHGLFLAPGYQRAVSGKADVEGFRVFYDVQDDGTLKVLRAVADDVTHSPVYLPALDVMRLDPERPTFYSTVWSHQLGGRGVKKTADLAYVKCFAQGRVRPLPEALAEEYGLDHRARPAHIEAFGGRRIGAPLVKTARADRTRP